MKLFVFGKTIKRKTESLTFIKIGSLVVAVVLWLYVIYSQNLEVTFKIPITYQNLPTTMIVSEISHKSINVVISGKSDAIRNVESKDFQAVIDFKNAKVGSAKRFPIQLVKVNVPENINVAEQKIQASVKLEYLVRKQVGIEPKIIGQLREDRTLGPISTEPEYISAEGPKSQMDSLDKIQTVDIDITNQKQTINKEVEINKQYQQNGIVLSDTIVKVNIPIYKYKQEEFEVPVVLKNTNNKYRYTMAKNNIKITLKVMGDDIDVIEDFTASADVSSINYKKIGKQKTEVLVPIKLLFKKDLDDNHFVTFEPAEIKIGVSQK
jgi:YbbR domain-containing protein